MKNLISLLIIVFVLIGCNQKKASKISLNIEGTWQMMCAEIVENDSLKLKDLSKTNFIKIINETHFSFFNQDKNGVNNFYSGAGTYELKENNYTEKLEFTTVEAIKNHQFSFLVKIKGDTLIQSGIEKVEAAGINRKIVEKYIKLK
jgi:hypothetical protein